VATQVLTAPSPQRALGWGASSPALGRSVERSFHTTRAVSALVSVAGYAALAIAWNWSVGWQVSIVSVAIAIHAFFLKEHPQPSLMMALTVDILWVAVTFVLVHPPALAVVPAVTYLVVAPVLALDGWRAGGVVIAAQAGIAAALAVAPSAMPGSRTPVVAIVVVSTHLPTMVWLITSATRQLRSRDELSERLVFQEARLRLITDNATDAIVALDGEGRIRFANRTIEKILGWAPKELAGRRITDLIPSLGAGRPSLAHVAGTVQMSVQGNHRDGRRIPIEMTLGKTSEGGYEIFVGVIRDVSEKVAAARRIEFQASLLDQVRVAVVAADVDGRLLYANASAVTALGLRAETLRRTTLAGLLAEEDRSLVLERPFTADGFWRSEVKLRGSDGKLFPALVTVTTVHSATGDPIGLAAIAVDITERKQTEERLSALLASKDEFVTSVSHELRTPLTVIVGMSQELKRSFHDFSSEDVHQLIELIADQSADLANIVQDLLVIGRSDGGGNLVINPSAIDVREELTASLILYVPNDRDRTLDVNVQLPAWADPSRLRQVIRNLMTNAVRYGGSNIRLSATQDEHLTVICLADNGPGIPEEEQAGIFEPYVRSHSTPASPGSMGVGLAVARKLSRLMGGDLVYHRRDGWSSFELSLPNFPSPSAAREIAS
jgi:PAS domain S-box-containing protein